jgi:hypothetical protein
LEKTKELRNFLRDDANEAEKASAKQLIKESNLLEVSHHLEEIIDDLATTNAENTSSSAQSNTQIVPSTQPITSPQPVAAVPPAVAQNNNQGHAGEQQGSRPVAPAMPAQTSNAPGGPVTRLQFPRLRPFIRDLKDRMSYIADFLEAGKTSWTPEQRLEVGNACDSAELGSFGIRLTDMSDGVWD